MDRELTLFGVTGIVTLGKKKATDRNTIEGLVIPCKWDETGKVVGVSIHTCKEEIFIVAHNRMESELMNQLHMKVGIKGRIMERLDGAKLIHVASYQPISN